MQKLEEIHRRFYERMSKLNDKRALALRKWEFANINALERRASLSIAEDMRATLQELMVTSEETPGGSSDDRSGSRT